MAYQQLHRSSTLEPTGFSESGNTTLGFVNATRTLTITPTGTDFRVLIQGTEFIYSSAQSVVISADEGMHYVYFDTDGVLKDTAIWNNNLITEKALVAMPYWNATDSEALDVGAERHLLMPGITHLRWHLFFGAQYDSGLGLSDMSVDGTGNNDADAQLSVDDGYIWDEDILHHIEDGVQMDLSPVFTSGKFYLSGATPVWRRTASSTHIAATTGTGRAAYNLFSGGSWSVAEVSNGDFVLMHLFATNADRNCGLNPIMPIMGQAVYTTKRKARKGANTEIANLVSLGLPTAEFVPLATVIVQTRNTYSNSGKQRIVSTDDGDPFVDWRTSGVSQSSAPASHANLVDRDLDGAHTNYLRIDGTRAMTGAIELAEEERTPATNNLTLFWDDSADTLYIVRDDGQKAAVTIGAWA